MNQVDHDRRSLALHQRVCARLRRDPALIDRAAATLGHWAEMEGPRGDWTAARWRELLDSRDIESIVAAATEPGERGDQLRQSSPLAVLLPPRERWEFLCEWKAPHGA